MILSRSEQFQTLSLHLLLVSCAERRNLFNVPQHQVRRYYTVTRELCGLCWVALKNELTTLAWIKHAIHHIWNGEPSSFIRNCESDSLKSWRLPIVLLTFINLLNFSKYWDILFYFSFRMILWFNNIVVDIVKNNSCGFWFFNLLSSVET